MRFARLGPAGHEQPVVYDAENRCWSLASVTTDIDGEFLAADGIERVRAALAAGTLAAFDPADLRIGAPIARPGMVLCIGLNYRRHAAETGAPVPAEPILFMKASRCVVGPDDTVLVPRRSVKTDYEVELAIVIGRRASYLESPAESAAHIAGYTISDDVSEREFQIERGGQWDKGKSCDTFNPLGPWLVPTSDLTAAGLDPQDLDMTLWVNGEQRQSSSTDDMIFGIDHLVWYASQFMVLEPGDIINTGTPAGVAMGMSGTPYLRAGDEVRISIEGLGEQRHVLGQA